MKWDAEKLAWVLHVSKEPFHRGLRVAVARREQRLLAPDQREAHRFELGECGLVEDWFGLVSVSICKRLPPNPKAEADSPGASSGSSVSPG